jgi:hypothetical protein
VRRVSELTSAADAAKRLAAALDAAACPYAIGGAIALGYWGQPRGTLDVDVTLFVDAAKPSEAIWILQQLGCQFQASTVLASFQQHGFAQVELDGIRIDVFLPTIDFYWTAKERIQTVLLGDQPVCVWDAETLCVFKMMFFRRKDLADVEQILRSRGASFSTDWTRAQLVTMYGTRDPRLISWDEIVAEVLRGD